MFAALQATAEAFTQLVLLQLGTLEPVAKKTREEIVAPHEAVVR